MTPTAMAPPPVVPVVSGTHRPLWSVMIPTFNCAKYLRQTLESVLAQDPGADQMQIEVVDDCSTKDDPESVVREIGNGRIAFFRQPKNLGPTKNFNSCINRSKGRWIHILHGDDFVSPDFYSTMELCMGEHSNLQAIFSRAFIVDEAGELMDLSPRLVCSENSFPEANAIYYSNPVRTPAVVVNRAYYEQHGGFDERFFHVADWDMWLRLLLTKRAMFLNRVLCSYRDFSGNHTASLSQTSADLRDKLDLGSKLAATAPQFNLASYNKALALSAYFRYLNASRRGDLPAAKSAYLLWKECMTLPQRLYVRAIYFAKRLHSFLMR